MNFDREQQQFDRTWRWLFPLVAILAVISALAWLVILAGGAALLWSFVR